MFANMLLAGTLTCTHSSLSSCMHDSICSSTDMLQTGSPSLCKLSVAYHSFASLQATKSWESCTGAAAGCESETHMLIPCTDVTLARLLAAAIGMLALYCC